MKQALSARPLPGAYGQTKADQVLQVLGIELRNAIVMPRANLSLERIDVIGHERRSECRHFIKHAS